MKNNKGFTLVEIIVVLVILAILIALLAPSLTGYIDKAKEKTALANARLIHQAALVARVELYANSNAAQPVNTQAYRAFNPGTGWGPATNNPDGSTGTLNPFTLKVIELVGDDVDGFFTVFFADKGVNFVIWTQDLPSGGLPRSIDDEIVGVYPEDKRPLWEHYKKTGNFNMP